jgi:hypothetical protein
MAKKQSLTRRLLKRIIPRPIQPTQIYYRQLFRESGRRVVSGPFRGMHYVDQAVGSVLGAKILGIYERELWAWTERACALGFDTIIDIGAAEGYYAVGMTYRLPNARIIAFEMDPLGRALLSKMAALNDVSGRLDIREKCELDNLAQAIPIGGKCLIISDVEGYESVLLDPHRIPALKNVYLMVELHDDHEPNVTATLRARFQPTHDIEEIWSEPRSFDEYPYKSLFRTLTPKSWIKPLVHEYREYRAPQNWFWMAPKNAAQ